MTTPDTPAPPEPQAEPCEVTVEAGNVVVHSRGGAAFALTPAAAVQTAERLFEAAASRPPGEHEPPFPPAELVDPRAG